MTHGTMRPSDRVAVAAVIDPDAYTAGTVTSGWVPIASFEKLLAVVMAGTLGASATLDAKLEQAQDGSGTGAKDVTDKAITQMTQAGGDSDKQAVINMVGEELDVNNGFTHVRLSMTVATATSDAGGTILGLNPRYGKASASDAASVAEIVS